MLLILATHLVSTPIGQNPYAMYRITDIDTIASVTDLRTQIDETIKAVEETEKGVLVQKNNEPIAVLVSIERWRELQGEDENISSSP